MTKFYIEIDGKDHEVSKEVHKYFLEIKTLADAFLEILQECFADKIGKRVKSDHHGTGSGN